MIRSSLNAILGLFDDDGDSPEELQELFNEVVLMTLSRATSVDSNINTVEVGLVTKIVGDLTKQQVTESDVRVAANSQIYESGSLSRYLNAVSVKLSTERRIELINALATVIMADKRVTEREVFFFNMVVSDLNVQPSDLVGLSQTQPF